LRFIVIFAFLILFANAKYYCISPNELIIRAYKEKLLILNTNTLKTYLKKYTYKRSNCDKNTKYFKLKQPYNFINAGITKAKKEILTIDMCPSSKKGFDKKLFLNLIKRYKNPVPVVIFITKKWALTHKKEFNLLKKWQKEKKLEITWGNHTATHPYKNNVPLSKNFVMLKNYNLLKDTLELEEFLIENNLTPSIFFRFPGLVCDKKSFETIKSLHYIIIGSNTWLAKGGKIKKSSIILIHANKNEEKGIKIFLNNLDKFKPHSINDSL